MELRQLRYFVRIVETGSMGSAALDLNIGVSALSQQMSRLESELAIRLLQRTSRGVTPTSAAASAPATSSRWGTFSSTTPRSAGGSIEPFFRRANWARSASSCACVSTSRKGK